MPQNFKGIVRILDNASNPRIALRGNTANVTLGGNDLAPAGPRPQGSGIPKVSGRDGKARDIPRGKNGRLGVKTQLGTETIHLAGAPGRIELGAEVTQKKKGRGGTEETVTTAAKTISLDGMTAGITLGVGRKKNAFGVVPGQDGNLKVKNAAGRTRFLVRADEGKVVVKNPNGKNTIRLQGDNGGLITLGRIYSGKIRLRLDGSRGNIFVGGGNQSGDLLVNNADEKNTIHLQGSGDIQGGHVWVKNANGDATVWLDGDGGQIVLGRHGQQGKVVVRNAAEKETIRLDGAAGDILLSNADCAEEFDVSGTEEVEPGTVMVIDQEDKVRESTRAYDKTVAGVISGAGDFRPGIVLDKKQSRNNRMPVAVMGKVYCKADTQNGPIEVGDLLTTSSTPGHAMKANDPLKAFGAVIGKALRPLKKGKGLVPILVALQ